MFLAFFLAATPQVNIIQQGNITPCVDNRDFIIVRMMQRASDPFAPTCSTKKPVYRMQKLSPNKPVMDKQGRYIIQRYPSTK